MLLLLFGDLQAVWADAVLSKVMLDLPMPAMQLLLASDELQASACSPCPTEAVDTVWIVGPAQMPVVTRLVAVADATPP